MNRTAQRTTFLFKGRIWQSYTATAYYYKTHFSTYSPGRAGDWTNARALWRRRANTRFFDILPKRSLQRLQRRRAAQPGEAFTADWISCGEPG